MKKFIANIIIKKIRKLDIGTCSNKKQAKYLFLRWLAEVFSSPKTNDIRHIIGVYVYDKYRQLADSLRDIFVLNNKIFIVTRRPGMWICKGGENVDAITKLINDKFCTNDYEIWFVEDTNSAVADMYNYFKIIRMCRDEDY